MWNDRKYKIFSRNYAMTGSADGSGMPQPAKSILCLPGYDGDYQIAASCIRQGLSHGYISTDAHVDGIERDCNLIGPIRKNLKDDELGIDLHECDLIEFAPSTRYDMVFLDLMGAWSTDLSEWFQDALVPALYADARVGITLSRFPRGRGNPRIYRVLSHVLATDRQLRRSIQSLGDSQTMKGEGVPYSGEIIHQTNRLSQSVELIPIWMIMSAFQKAGKSVRYHGAYAYNDTSLMITYHFSRIRNGQPNTLPDATQYFE